MARHELQMRSNPKWIRGYRGGRLVVDSRCTLFVWEHEYYPAWYVPIGDVDATVVSTTSTFDGGACGVGTTIDLHVGDDVMRAAGWRHLEHPELRDHVRLEWDSMDSWFEEDVEVFVHPRSPFVRVDVLPSSKHVRVFVDGEVVADSVRSSVLYEAELPPRYYLPQVDVRMELLTPTDSESACPYKGWANYWSVTVAGETRDDIAWAYRTPLPESVGVAGRVCFYNEQVDIEVDGELLERPVTKFS
ncbi:MAG: DUF427 domain-containing protein [Ilumatobacter sp.]